MEYAVPQIHILKSCPNHDVNDSVAYFEVHPELKSDGNNSKRAMVSAFKNPDSWLKSLCIKGNKQELSDGVKDVAGAIDSEELKSVMTKLTMVPDASEIETMIAVVNHDDDQTVDYEEFELMMMERTADVPTSTIEQPVPMPQVTTQTVARPYPASQLQTVEVPMLAAFGGDRICLLSSRLLPAADGSYRAANLRHCCKPGSRSAPRTISRASPPVLEIKKCCKFMLKVRHRDRLLLLLFVKAKALLP